MPEHLIKEVSLPEMIDVTCRYSFKKLTNPESTLKEELKKSSLKTRIKPGSRIAVTAGSRGINNIGKILRIICDEVKKLGGKPFLVPAMGSHGEGTIKGQKEILTSLGITEKEINVPVISSNETVKLTENSDGIHVFFDKESFYSDGIIVVNRIKPHTDFESVIESGLLKMLAVGLGRDKGAEQIHRDGIKGMKKRIPQIGKFIIKRAPVILGVGIVEGSIGETAIIEAIEPENFEKRERELLKMAKEISIKLPFRDIDLLIVDEMGKDVSGTGLDTNVIGRRMLYGEKDPKHPKITRIAALDLTDESHGNAAGVGLADIITERLFNKIDFNSFYFNTLTSTFIERGKIPVVLPSDEAAIKVGLSTSWVNNYRNAKVVRIKNTLSLNKIAVSKSLFEKNKENNDIVPEGKYYMLKFNRKGNLF